MEIQIQVGQIPNLCPESLIVMACPCANLKDGTLPPNWTSSLIYLEDVLHLSLPKAEKAILNIIHDEAF